MLVSTSGCNGFQLDDDARMHAKRTWDVTGKLSLGNRVCAGRSGTRLKLVQPRQFLKFNSVKYFSFQRCSR